MFVDLFSPIPTYSPPSPLTKLPVLLVLQLQKLWDVKVKGDKTCQGRKLYNFRYNYQNLVRPDVWKQCLMICFCSPALLQSNTRSFMFAPVKGTPKQSNSCTRSRGHIDTTLSSQYTYAQGCVGVWVPVDLPSGVNSDKIERL